MANGIFASMPATREPTVEALTFPQNTASKRLLTKLGFKKEGLLREYEYPKGSPQDMAIYALLARERLRQINQM